MKKNLFVLTLITAVGLSLAGCGADNSNPAIVPQNDTANSAVMEVKESAASAQQDSSQSGTNSSITEAQAKEIAIEDAGVNAASETDGIISRDKAIEIVLAKVSGASEDDVRIELDNDDGHQVYEGEIRYNRKEYEFELNAEDGSILEWSEEYDD